MFEVVIILYYKSNTYITIKRHLKQLAIRDFRIIYNHTLSPFTQYDLHAQ